jgi:hypothetical protein
MLPFSPLRVVAGSALDQKPKLNPRRRIMNRLAHYEARRIAANIAKRSLKQTGIARRRANEKAPPERFERGLRGLNPDTD